MASVGREGCRRQRKQGRCLSQYPSTLRAYWFGGLLGARQLSRTLNGDTDILVKHFFLWGSAFFSNGRFSLNRRLYLKLFKSVQCAWWNEGKILSIVICTPFLTAFFNRSVILLLFSRVLDVVGILLRWSKTFKSFLSTSEIHPWSWFLHVSKMIFFARRKYPRKNWNYATNKKT